ncbi:MAG TPA: hypothetical protein VHS06_04695, partial [Chloroflexota bacterium]|nr:hypothetical protein [Chloroflexota bacterium]
VSWLVMAEEVAVQDLREGRFQRSMAAMAAFSAVVSGWEAYSQHLRGAFSNWLMWTPVLLTPPMVIAALASPVAGTWGRLLLLAVSLVSLLDGVVGFYFHIRGIGRLPGGFRIGQYNVVMGPPIFAPLLLCSVGILGLLATLLRPERLRPQSRLAEMVDDKLPILLSGRRPVPLGRSPRMRWARTIARRVARGRFQGGMALIAAFLGLLSAGEVYFEHLRGSFNQRVMWTPIWLTLPTVAAAVGAAQGRAPAAHRALTVLSVATFLDGLVGFGFHLRGIRRMPGGFSNLQFNVTLGPPLFAPLLFTAVGLLGFISTILRRKEG